MMSILHSHHCDVVFFEPGLCRDGEGRGEPLPLTGQLDAKVIGSVV